MIRPESSPAQVDSGAKIIRVKESGGSVYRMKWNGGAYVITTEEVQIFEDSGTTPLTLDTDEERLAFWRPPAKRWETIQPGSSDPGPGLDSTLFADFTVTTDSAWNDTTVIADISAYWGGTPADTTAVTVYKIPNQAVPMFVGDKFRGVWDTTRERWEMFWYPGLRITVKAVTDGGGSTVDDGTSTFTVSALSQLLVNGWRLPAIDLTVTNNPPVYLEPGSEVYIRFNLQAGTGFSSHWDTGDMRNFLPALKGIGGWAAGGALQLLVDEASDDPEWITPDSYSGSAEQAICHNSGALKCIDIDVIEIDLV